MAKTEPGYRCDECGWTTLKWVGRCGECQTWGSVIQVGMAPGRPRVQAAAIGVADQAAPITHAQTDTSSHNSTGIDELDRVLGGGIVPGAAILLSGEPGVGKSTLLLDVASQTSRAGTRTLYISAEESIGQVRLRAERTGALEDELFLSSTTDLGAILGHVEANDPGLLIVDSVQTVSANTIESAPGGPAQVREVAATLIRLAKEKSLPVILVGHVTKDGQVAGPRTLEHLVDVVCHFEGDPNSSLRFVRAFKNRFGPTDEVGCFEMSENGIAQVADPSALFRSAASAPSSGTCTTIALEGKRDLPVEIQALIVPSAAPQPRRVVNGVDSSRVAMILAILERRSGLKLTQADVYVSTVGGIRLSEPSADLAIALAIASSAKDVALPQELVAFGELSLSGEIRSVASASRRADEARRLGFSTIVGKKGGFITEALREAFGKAASPSAPF